MKSFLLIISFIFINSKLLSQNQDPIVAQIGNEKIFAKEFKSRLELSPYLPENKNIDPDSVKYDFLYSLIAEKLWAKEADKLGITNTENFNFYYKPLEEMFVRDALFKIEVEDKVLLSSNDINNGIVKSQSKLNAEIVSSNDSASIFNFYNRLDSKTNFDSLIVLDKNLFGKTFDITLGTLKDEEIEDSIYSLPVNGYTAPIHSEVGWVIMIVRNKLFTPIDLGNQQSVDNMKKIIRNRRIEKRYEDFLNGLLSGTTININPESFELLYDRIWKQLKDKLLPYDSTSYFELTESDFNIIKLTLGNGVYKHLFSLVDKNIEIENFLSNLAFKGFHLNQLDSLTVLQMLSKTIKQFVQEQLITEEGYRRGLNLTLQVRNDLKLWKENYLAQSYFNINLDSVKISDNEVYDYYLNNFVDGSNIKLLNIRLVTLRDLDEVSKIFESLKQGENFSQIVLNYGKTDSLVNENGETGLKPKILLGYLGNVASDLKLDEVYGPIKRNNSYTILQVIERQDSNDSLKLSFDLIKDKIRNDLRQKKLTDRLTSITSNLVENNNVKIFNNVVDKIQSTNIPFFVHRLMGFGGRIAGVPLTTPFSGWINSEVKQKIFP